MSDRYRLITSLLRRLRPTFRSAPGKESKGQASTPQRAREYPGDFHGVIRAQYAPNLDGKPDPGEIVWTWVPYEEDHSRGKDRPVLIIGHDGGWLVGLMLSTTDHTGMHLAHGERWMDIGAGPWDRQGRDSEVRLDRKIRVDPASVRREGAIVPPDLYHRIIAGS